MTTIDTDIFELILEVGVHRSQLKEGLSDGAIKKEVFCSFDGFIYF